MGSEDKNSSLALLSSIFNQSNSELFPIPRESISEDEKSASLTRLHELLLLKQNCELISLLREALNAGKAKELQQLLNAKADTERIDSTNLDETSSTEESTACEIEEKDGEDTIEDLSSSAEEANAEGTEKQRSLSVSSSGRNQASRKASPSNPPTLSEFLNTGPTAQMDVPIEIRSGGGRRGRSKDAKRPKKKQEGNDSEKRTEQGQQSFRLRRTRSNENVPLKNRRGDGGTKGDSQPHRPVRRVRSDERLQLQAGHTKRKSCDANATRSKLKELVARRSGTSPPRRNASFHRKHSDHHRNPSVGRRKKTEVAASHPSSEFPIQSIKVIDNNNENHDADSTCTDIFVNQDGLDQNFIVPESPSVAPIQFLPSMGVSKDASPCESHVGRLKKESEKTQSEGGKVCRDTAAAAKGRAIHQVEPKGSFHKKDDTKTATHQHGLKNKVFGTLTRMTSFHGKLPGFGEDRYKDYDSDSGSDGESFG